MLSFMFSGGLAFFSKFNVEGDLIQLTEGDLILYQMTFQK